MVDVFIYYTVRSMDFHSRERDENIVRNISLLLNDYNFLLLQSENMLWTTELTWYDSW